MPADACCVCSAAAVRCASAACAACQSLALLPRPLTSAASSARRSALPAAAAAPADAERPAAACRHTGAASGAAGAGAGVGVGVGGSRPWCSTHSSCWLHRSRPAALAGGVSGGRRNRAACRPLSNARAVSVAAAAAGGHSLVAVCCSRSHSACTRASICKPGQQGTRVKAQEADGQAVRGLEQAARRSAAPLACLTSCTPIAVGPACRRQLPRVLWTPAKPSRSLQGQGQCRMGCYGHIRAMKRSSPLTSTSQLPPRQPQPGALRKAHDVTLIIAYRSSVTHKLRCLS